MSPESHPGPGPRGSRKGDRGAGPREKKLRDFVERCRQAGLRRTRTLRDLLRALLDGGRPMTLNELHASEHLENQCDKATLYRILQRLVEKEVARRLGVSGKASYFYLIHPDSDDGYLICTGCGTIDSIPTPGSVQDLKDHLQETSGYAHLYHQLEIYGTCPHCIGMTPSVSPQDNPSTCK